MKTQMCLRWHYMNDEVYVRSYAFACDSLTEWVWGLQIRVLTQLQLDYKSLQMGSLKS